MVRLPILFQFNSVDVEIVILRLKAFLVNGSAGTKKPD